MKFASTKIIVGLGIPNWVAECRRAHHIVHRHLSRNLTPRSCHGGSLQAAADENRRRQGLLPELEVEGFESVKGARINETLCISREKLTNKKRRSAKRCLAPDPSKASSASALSGGEHPETVAEDPGCAGWSHGGFGQLGHGRHRTSARGKGQRQRASRVRISCIILSYLGIIKKKMETTMVYWGYVRVIFQVRGGFYWVLSGRGWLSAFV